MRSALALLSLLMAAGSPATESPADCAGVSEARSKSRPYFAGETLMTSLLMLQSLGEAKFHPTFTTPVGQCIFERFEVAGNKVEALHSPFDKGGATLHWQFETGGPETRSVYVIYDGMASMMAKKEIFFVVEERTGKISYYAMFRDQPTYAVLKPLVTGILSGTEKPLAVVYWPPGAKEPVIDAYDSKRLK